jgi:hypothetical protein
MEGDSQGQSWTMWFFWKEGVSAADILPTAQSSALQRVFDIMENSA